MQPREDQASAHEELGRLAMMTPTSRREAAHRTDFGRIFDLAVAIDHEMPMVGSGARDSPLLRPISPVANGDALPSEPAERFYLDAIDLPLHAGTHLDAFSHLIRGDEIWGGFKVADALGDRGWLRCSVGRLPPIVSRGVLIDLASALGVEMLPSRYEATLDDVRRALVEQATELRRGDVVIFRTGRMRAWPDPRQVLIDSPGISIEVARYVIEVGGAMILGADNMSVERALGNFAAADPAAMQTRQPSWPVHSYCLRDVGAPLMEFLNCEEIAAARIYEFCFVATPLKIHGGTGVPIRPLAIAYLSGPDRPDDDGTPTVA
jgi:kynurenine formamidase